MDEQRRNRLARGERASERRVNRFPDAHYADGSAALERGNKTNRGFVAYDSSTPLQPHTRIRVCAWLGTAPINARDNGMEVYHYLVRR